jgi:MFS family permease
MLAATVPMVFLPMFSARVALAMSTRNFFSLGLVVVAIGGAVIAFGADAQSVLISLVGMAIAGSGTAIVNPQMVAKLVGLVPREQAGAVSAITVILRQGGFALGIAMLGGVLRALTSGEPVPAALQDFNAYAILFALAGISALIGAVLVFTLIDARTEAG